MDNLLEIFSEISGELSVAIAIATFYILLGINENTLSNNYIKKFNILCYFLFGMLKILFETPTTIIFVCFLIIVFLASLNMAENVSNLEKNLSRTDIILFNFIKWLFFTKFYIFIGTTFLASIFYNVELSNTIIVVTLITGLMYHQFSYIKDYFGYKDFDFLKKRLNDLDYFKNIEKADFEEIKTLLGFILYMEDKDYFERKNLNLDLMTIFNRKRENVLKRIIRLKRMDYRDISYRKLFKKYWRGYSTIEMQVIRRTVLKEDSYQYTYRRKILVEHFYAKYFFKAIRKQLIRYNINEYNHNPERTKSYIHTTIKILFLQYYYQEILDKPNSIDEFILNARSRVNKETYKFEYEKFIKSYHKYEYEYLLKDHLYAYLIFNHEGGNFMKSDNIESWDGKIFYKEPGKRITYIENGEASPHSSSPDNSKIVYIKPFEWEEIGKVYMYDLNKNEKEILIKPSDDKKVPKKVIWVSENELGLIMGFGMGTVAIGGDVYIYNLNNNELKALTNYNPDIQITDLELTDTYELLLTGIKYIDNQFTESEFFTDTIEINY